MPKDPRFRALHGATLRCRRRPGFNRYRGSVLVARLSKSEIKAHSEAEKLLTKERLNDDEREFVLDNWQESARHVNSAAGAFFTPTALALDAAIYAGSDGKIIDLCAGIGALALACWWRSNHEAEITCVEINPDYAEIGRKLLPEARWVVGSVDALPDLGYFDCAIANPPFGKTAKLKGPRYSGEDDLAVVDIASDIARWGVFILPSMSCPFEYSGRQNYRERVSAKHDRFLAKTGIELRCESIDCEYHRAAWRGVSPSVEVVSADFEELQAKRIADRPPDLFAEAA
jgi:predicted RNA methylase